MEQAKVN